MYGYTYSVSFRLTLVPEFVTCKAPLVLRVFRVLHYFSSGLMVPSDPSPCLSGRVTGLRSCDEQGSGGGSRLLPDEIVALYRRVEITSIFAVPQSSRGSVFFSLHILDYSQLVKILAKLMVLVLIVFHLSVRVRQQLVMLFLVQGCTYTGRQDARATKFCTVSVGPQCGTCFVSSCWHPWCWRGLKIFV